MYEHAFHIDYGADAARGDDVLMDDVDVGRDEVRRRAEWARKAGRP